MTIFLALRLLYLVCLLLTTAIGWRHGGRSERCGVLIVAGGSLLTLAIMQSPLFDWRVHREVLVMVDVAVLAALGWLALRSPRFWPIWAAAFHLISVCSHGAILILPPSLLQIYAFFQGFWSYPVMACIVIGALSRRARRRARDRSPAPAGASRS